ncbi:MAG: hypothetical protein ACR2IE_17340 [Candidatus Sumerlaeaceae bacterium]
MRCTESGRGTRAWSAWKRAGEKAAHIIGIAIFALLWLVALGPMALASRLRGKHLLPHFTGRENTYYVPRESSEPTLERMKRQW